MTHPDRPARVHLTVPMHCDGCATTIRNGLDKLGVADADADADRDLVTVTDPGEVDEATIRAKLADLGFTPSTASDSEDSG